MEKPIIAANWKSNKTVGESLEWLKKFSDLAKDAGLLKNKTVILCAPYTNLYPLKLEVAKLGIPILLGAQDVSPYAEGAYTGQISARMIKDIAEWVIVGHSERRKYFNEHDEDLARKVEQIKTAGLKVIYCVSDKGMPVPEGVDIVAYEPLWAIGTGKTDTPENAAETVQSIKAKTGISLALYGGSVNKGNVGGFLKTGSIDGVLIGGASLEADSFAGLISASV